MAGLNPAQRETLPDLKLFKPETAEIVHRVYSPAAESYAMSFGVLLPFVLHPPGQEVELAFSSIWEHAAEVLQHGEILDEGWPKPFGEFLAAGHCYTPAGYRSQPVSARITVGALEKQLAVFGRRQLGVGGRFSEPAPFDRIALTPANAFGGAGHPFNPEGKGMPDASGETELPNVELVQHLMMSAADRPPTAGFGPLPCVWPERARYLGRQDDHWRNTRWPHLPEDSDARYFMAAAGDQHLSGFWQGGEAVSVLNMHPEFPELRGRVPKTRPRFFVHQSGPAGDVEFKELKVNLDTIWLLPETRLGVMIFRSSIPVIDPDGRDINAFYAEFEDPREPATPAATYLNSCMRAMAPHLYENVPDPNSPEFKAAIQAMDEDGILETMRQQRAHFQAAMEHAGVNEEELLKWLLANPQTREFAQTVSKRSRTLTGFFNEIEVLVDLIKAEDAGNADHSPSQPAMKAALTPYPKPGEHAAQAPEPADAARQAALHDATAAARNRQQVVNAITHGYSCAQLDLTHANLAGLDLSGMDFTGAILAGANLAGAQLQGAVLNQVHAAEARFDAANLAGCQMAGAGLYNAGFTGAILRGANLDHSDCSGANFSGADLSGASLRGTQLARAWLQGVRAERLIAPGAQFLEANLEHAQLPAAVLDEANLSGALAQNINLEDASGLKIDFTQADLRNARLSGAQLSHSRAGHGTSLDHAQLTGARIEHAGWAGASLQHAAMSGMHAQAADFSDTLLTGSSLHRADLRAACFDRALLKEADLSACNLMQASFIHSHLQQCNFEHSNLYNATFKDSDIAGTRFKHANLDRTALATE